MKTTNCLLMLGLLVSVAHGQVLILTGRVTAASGIYSSAFAPAARVELSLDFSHLPEDVFLGTNPYEGRFWVNGSFTIGGEPVIEFPGTEFLYGVGLHDTLLDQPGGEGLFIGTGWDGATPGSFFQYFLSQHDILSSRNLFPAGIPLSEFSRTDGYYSNDTPNASGRVDWLITDYSGFAEGIEPSLPPPPPSGVPEPGTYGRFAAVGLLFLLFARHRISGPAHFRPA